MRLPPWPRIAALTISSLLAGCQCDISGPSACLSSDDCPSGFYCDTTTELCTAGDSGIAARADAARGDAGRRDTEPGDLVGSDASADDGASVSDSAAVDATSPGSLTVTITPIDGAIGVAVDAHIVLTFSTAMNQPSVENDGFCLAGAGTCLPGSFSWNNQSTVVFTPDLPLAGATPHTATVRASCSDSQGRSLAGTGGPGCSVPEQCARFTTSDGTPPTVTVSPTDLARAVGPDEQVRLTFSEPMLQSSVEDRFILAQGGLPIAGSFSWVSPSVMEYAPATGLQCSTSYDVTLAAGATDLSGTAIAGVGGSSCVAPETCASFTTRAAQRECSTCTTGDCVDVLVSQSAGCGCAQTFPAPNCNMPTTYCVPCGCPTCPCDYECYFERQQETYECNCADVCR